MIKKLALAEARRLFGVYGCVWADCESHYVGLVRGCDMKEIGAGVDYDAAFYAAEKVHYEGDRFYYEMRNQKR